MLWGFIARLRGPITKIFQPEGFIVGQYFKTFGRMKFPQLFFKVKVITLLLTKLAPDRTGRISVVVFFVSVWTLLGSLFFHEVGFKSLRIVCV